MLVVDILLIFPLLHEAEVLKSLNLRLEKSEKLVNFGLEFDMIILGMQYQIELVNYQQADVLDHLV